MSEDGYPSTPWIEADDDEPEEEPRTLVRSNAAIWTGNTGRKAPRGWHPCDGSDDRDLEDEVPDLGAYFEEWDMPIKDQVIMCRAYASMLAASSKAQPKKPKK